MDLLVDVVTSYGQQRADLACLEGKAKLAAMVMGLIVAHRNWYPQPTVAQLDRLLNDIVDQCTKEVTLAQQAVDASRKPLV